MIGSQSITQQQLDPLTKWQSQQGFGEPSNFGSGGYNPIDTSGGGMNVMGGGATGGYTNFAAQLEALRNGTPSAQVFGGGVAGGMPTPAGGSFGSNMDSFYGGLGIDQSANPFQGQLEKAFPGGTSPFQTYAQENPGAYGPGNPRIQPVGSHRIPGADRVSGDGGGQAGQGGGYGLGSNPYQGAQADAIGMRSQEFLDNALNGIRSNSVGVGGLGGSRQGVAQGIATSKAADYLQGNLANLYGGNWNQEQNRDLSRYGMDQNFFLGNRGADQGDFRNGLAAVGLAESGDWSGLNQANGIYSPWSGFGNSTNSSQSGGGAMGAVGGGLAGFGFAGQNGWWK